MDQETSTEKLPMTLTFWCFNFFNINLFLRGRVRRRRRKPMLPRSVMYQLPVVLFLMERQAVRLQKRDSALCTAEARNRRGDRSRFGHNDHARFYRLVGRYKSLRINSCLGDKAVAKEARVIQTDRWRFFRSFLSRARSLWDVQYKEQTRTNANQINRT